MNFGLSRPSVILEMRSASHHTLATEFTERSWDTYHLGHLSDYDAVDAVSWTSRAKWAVLATMNESCGWHLVGAVPFVCFLGHLMDLSPALWKTVIIFFT